MTNFQEHIQTALTIAGKQPLTEDAKLDDVFNKFINTQRSSASWYHTHDLIEQDELTVFLLALYSKHVQGAEESDYLRHHQEFANFYAPNARKLLINGFQHQDLLKQINSKIVQKNFERIKDHYEKNQDLTACLQILLNVELTRKKLRQQFKLKLKELVKPNKVLDLDKAHTLLLTLLKEPIMKNKHYIILQTFYKLCTESEFQDFKDLLKTLDNTILEDGIKKLEKTHQEAQIRAPYVKASLAIPAGLLTLETTMLISEIVFHMYDDLEPEMEYSIYLANLIGGMVFTLIALYAAWHHFHKYSHDYCSDAQARMNFDSDPEPSSHISLKFTRLVLGIAALIESATLLFLLESGCHRFLDLEIGTMGTNTSAPLFAMLLFVSFLCVKAVEANEVIIFTNHAEKKVINETLENTILEPLDFQGDSSEPTHKMSQFRAA